MFLRLVDELNPPSAAKLQQNTTADALAAACHANGLVGMPFAIELALGDSPAPFPVQRRMISVPETRTQDRY